jgi:uncharacterized membrane protein YphA (DoxX/SURF4 family)
MTAKLRRWVFLSIFFILPWIALNIYWIATGELREPVWLLLTNLLIAFFGFAAPSLDRRSGKAGKPEVEPRPLPGPCRRAA